MTKIFQNSQKLKEYVVKGFEKYYEEKSQSSHDYFKDNAKNYFIEILDEVIKEVNDNYDSKDQKYLENRCLNSMEKEAFFENLPRGAVAVYYKNANIENLPANSKIYTPLVVCTCHALPFVHFYKCTPNTNKGCPLHKARSSNSKKLKCLLLSFPEILRYVAVESLDEVKTLCPGDSKKQHKISLICKKCNEPKNVRPYSFYRTYKDEGKWGCTSCSSKNARESAKERREKVSHNDILSQTYSSNNIVSPDEVSVGSQDIYLWYCQFCEEDYPHPVVYRTMLSNCKCIARSSDELAIAIALRNIFPESYSVELRYVIDGYEVDVFCATLELIIEYDGQYYHKDKRKCDFLKAKNLAGQGYNVLRLIEEENGDHHIKFWGYNESEPKTKVIKKIDNERYGYAKELAIYLLGLYPKVATDEKKDEINSNLLESIEIGLWDCKKINNFKIAGGGNVTLKSEFPSIELIIKEGVNPRHYVKNSKRFGGLSYNNDILFDFEEICERDECRCIPTTMNIHNFLRIVKRGYCGERVNLNIERIKSESSDLPKREDNKKSPGTRFIRLLKEKGFAIRKLAEESNIRRAKVSDFVNNVREPTLDEIDEMSKVLKIPQNEINFWCKRP